MEAATVRKAIAIIQAARRTHANWAEYLKREPAGAQELVPTVEAAGSLEHHERYLRDYDLVLKVLFDVMEAAAPAKVYQMYWVRPSTGVFPAIMGLSRFYSSVEKAQRECERHAGEALGFEEVSPGVYFANHNGHQYRIITYEVH